MENKTSMFDKLEIRDSVVPAGDGFAVREEYALPGVFKVSFDFIEDTIFVHPKLYQVTKTKLKGFKQFVQYLCKFICDRDGAEYIAVTTPKEKFVKFLSDNKYTKHKHPIEGYIYMLDREDF